MTNGSSLDEEDLLILEHRVEGRLRAEVERRVALSCKLGDDEIKALAAGLMSFLKQGFLPNFVEPLITSKMRRLEERVRELEQRPLLEDAGIWNAKSEYFRGNCVICDGSSWVCKADNTSREQPGKSDAWRLLAQRGRNGRDATGSR